MADRLVARFRPSRTAALKVFCLPYAGGSAAAFREWAVLGDHLDVEVFALELPGHGRRVGECPELDVVRLADELAADIDRPYAVFGHSLGARLGFELTRNLRDAGVPEPVRLFVSGSGGPRYPRVGRGDSALPDVDFVRRVAGMGGTPAAVLGDPELRELFLPVIRSDFAWGDDYEYVPGPLLTCPITAFAGSEDPEAPPEQVDGWAAETTGDFRLVVLPGGHFFLHDQQTALLAAVADSLGEVA
jgi:surfactin synthase thioesterase subunit